jgi:hypothetical protein
VVVALEDFSTYLTLPLIPDLIQLLLGTAVTGVAEEELKE